MKSYPFDDALKILANVLERDGKKNRRAKKDRIKLDSKAVRLSLRSAAQACIENKKHWGVGPAKARNRYISMHILAPGFVLEPERFVMHSHATRIDHSEPDPMVRHGTSGRVTSVTVGKMPNRQVIVYDKRKEVIARRKVHWWEIWNACLAHRGEPPLDPKDREGSQVWRVELRAGKSHLKKRWGGKTWADLDDKLGSLLLKTLDEVR